MGGLYKGVVVARWREEGNLPKMPPPRIRQPYLASVALRFYLRYTDIAKVVQIVSVAAVVVADVIVFVFNAIFIIGDENGNSSHSNNNMMIMVSE